MMTFGKYVNGINVGVFQRLYKPGRVKIRSHVGDQWRRVKIQVDLAKTQLSWIHGVLRKRHIRGGTAMLSFGQGWKRDQGSAQPR